MAEKARLLALGLFVAYAGQVEPSPLSWQEKLLQSVPSGIDQHQLERFLRLTPTQRLEEMQQLLENAEALRHGNELSHGP